MITVGNVAVLGCLRVTPQRTFFLVASALFACCRSRFAVLHSPIAVHQALPVLCAAARCSASFGRCRD
jgi:hypothetical protein